MEAASTEGVYALNQLCAALCRWAATKSLRRSERMLQLRSICSTAWNPLLYESLVREAFCAFLYGAALDCPEGPFPECWYAHAVTVGAVSVLLLLVRTSMEETPNKKFSPM